MPQQMNSEKINVFVCVYIYSRTANSPSKWYNISVTNYHWSPSLLISQAKHARISQALLETQRKQTLLQHPAAHHGTLKLSAKESAIDREEHDSRAGWNSQDPNPKSESVLNCPEIDLLVEATNDASLPTIIGSPCMVHTQI